MNISQTSLLSSFTGRYQVVQSAAEKAADRAYRASVKALRFPKKLPNPILLPDPVIERRLKNPWDINHPIHTKKHRFIG